MKPVMHILAIKEIDLIALLTIKNKQRRPAYVCFSQGVDKFISVALV